MLTATPTMAAAVDERRARMPPRIRRRGRGAVTCLWARGAQGALCSHTKNLKIKLLSIIPQNGGDVEWEVMEGEALFMQGWVYGGSGGEVHGSLAVLARPDAASCDAFFGWRNCKQQALFKTK